MEYRILPLNGVFPLVGLGGVCGVVGWLAVFTSATRFTDLYKILLLQFTPRRAKEPIKVFISIPIAFRPNI
jgi:hypothetical protein